VLLFNGENRLPCSVIGRAPLRRQSCVRNYVYPTMPDDITPDDNEGIQTAYMKAGTSGALSIDGT